MCQSKGKVRVLPLVRSDEDSGTMLRVQTARVLWEVWSQLSLLRLIPSHERLRRNHTYY